MMKPLFAKDRQLERNLTQSEALGAKLLHVASPSDFNLNDLVFVGEADGTGVEFLGGVAAVGGDSITLSHGLAAARDSSATLWRSGAVLRWETVASEPVERSFREGIAVERSVGGALWSVRVAEAVREDTLRFRGVSRAQFQAVRDWLGAWARSGLDDFTWVDESRAAARVRLLDCDFEQAEKSPGALALTLHLAVLQEGGYA